MNGLAIGEFLLLLAFDALFLGACAALVWGVAQQRRAAFAVLRRNFVGYFSNPTGYVFLCLFVLLSSVFAFWFHEFYTANLANLDQLNKYLPYVMILFIPAITMSIWAEERRQGTDELLLTLPATDFDIVMGKYLAAAAIYTASLLFSQITTCLMLIALSLGDLDTGLILSTYLGYWFIGLAMIAIGMVASFLTNNLTVGFILGFMFNAPLAFAIYADVLPLPGRVTRAIAGWGMLANFDDFGRGVLSLSATVYFVMLIAIGLYLSMVLIGRRHWLGGIDGTSMLGHYLVRAALLVAFGVGVVLVVTRLDARLDTTEGKVSSLSTDTRKLIDGLETEGRKVYIDAYVSSDLPDQYVKTRFELLSMLKEFERHSGGKVQLTVHDNLSISSKEAKQAEDRFGIRPEMIRTRQRGAIVDKELILGAVFRCGLDRVVVPFFDYGIPVEYEVVRSISTVTRDQRKRLGVVRTGASMMGGFSFAGGQPQQLPKQEIIVELEKQYDVREVDPTNAIPTDEYDALICVQPSSLGPAEMQNFIAAVKAGVPTAIFEDPRPLMMPVTPTGEDNPPQGGMMGMMGGGGMPQPKGDIRQLWDLLGIEIPGEPGGPAGVKPSLVWQAFNPYPKLRLPLGDVWVFASNEAPGGPESLRPDDIITSGLDEILFPVPGAIKKVPGAAVKFRPLVTTGAQAGTLKYDDFQEFQRDEPTLQAMQGMADGEKIVAVRIEGEADDTDSGEAPPAGEAKDEGKDEDQPAGPRRLEVVYVADIDVMVPAFLRIRARPNEDLFDVDFRFENVTFLLNIVDSLAGQDEFIPIRKRKPHLSTLRLIESYIAQNQDQERRERDGFQADFVREEKQAREERDELVKETQNKLNELLAQQREGKPIDFGRLEELRATYQQTAEVADRRLQVKIEQLRLERERKIREIQDQNAQQLESIRFRFRLLSLVLPPLPPLIVGICVFVARKLRERESVLRNTARRR